MSLKANRLFSIADAHCLILTLVNTAFSGLKCSYYFCITFYSAVTTIDSKVVITIFLTVYITHISPYVS